MKRHYMSANEEDRSTLWMLHCVLGVRDVVPFGDDMIDMG